MTSGSSIAALDVERYRLVRGQIEFEDNLIAQRISWFVASQSFLFTAYAITLNAPAQPAKEAYGQQQEFVYFLIPVVAIAACVLIFLAIVAGVVVQAELRGLIADQEAGERLGMLPAIQGSGRTRMMGRAASLGLPLVFVTVWLVIFIQSLIR